MVVTAAVVVGVVMVVAAEVVAVTGSVVVRVVVAMAMAVVGTEAYKRQEGWGPFLERPDN